LAEQVDVERVGEPWPTRGGMRAPDALVGLDEANDLPTSR